MSFIEMTRYGWFILTLLFLQTTMHYLDRIVSSVLIPIIRDNLPISTGYSGGLPVHGQGARPLRQADRVFGARRGRVCGRRPPRRSTAPRGRLYPS